MTIISIIIKQMGCGSSVAQVANSMKDGPFQIKLFQNQGGNEGGEIDGKVYLFGQTRTHRKVIQLNLNSNSIRSLSNRIRIPVPRIHYDPIEQLYQQSQQIFHLGAYGLSILPPFNKMVVLYIQSNLLFICGGKDFDSYNIKNEAFQYQIKDETNDGSNQNRKSQQENGRTLSKSKYSSNRFLKLASMSVKRYGHMGIFMNKLKTILIFGGINDKQEVINSCEKYGVLDNSWKEIPPMPNPRAFGNCFHFNNKVYVFGGRSFLASKKTKKIDVFSCETNHWQTLDVKLHRGIQQSLVFSQSPNQILIIGGKTYFGSTKSVIKVDIVSKTFIWDSDLNYGYESVKKGIKTKSNILVFGGNKDSIQVYKNSEWLQKKFDNKKLIDFEQLDLFSFSSQSQHVAYLPQEPTNKSTPLKNQLIIFGNDQYPCMLVGDLQEGTFQKQSISMRLKIRSNMSIVQYQAAKYFLAGGCDWKQSKSFSSTYLYHRGSNELQQTVKMAEKKYNFAICYNQGFIYIFGGYDSFDKTSKKSSARFNISNESWESLPTMRRARNKCFCLVVSPDKIAVFGGVNGMQAVAGIQILNITQKKFDIYEPNLYLPQSILCAYTTTNNQNSIYIINKIQSKKYQMTTVSLVPSNINSNRSVVSNNLQTIDLNGLSPKQQKPNNISQSHDYHVKEQVAIPNKIIQQKQDQNSNIIVIKPNFIQIKPKVGESQQSQTHQLNKQPQRNSLDQQFEMQNLDVNKYNIGELNPTQQLLIKDAENQPVQIQKQYAIVIQSQVVEKKEQIIEPTPSVKEEIQLITNEDIGWLNKQSYKVIDRIDRIYFITDEECIQLLKNSGETKSIKMQNYSNLPLKFIK